MYFRSLLCMSRVLFLLAVCFEVKPVYAQSAYASEDRCVLTLYAVLTTGEVRAVKEIFIGYESIEECKPLVSEFLGKKHAFGTVVERGKDGERVKYKLTSTVQRINVRFYEANCNEYDEYDEENDSRENNPTFLQKIFGL